jgi:hypothetical protein
MLRPRGLRSLSVIHEELLAEPCKNVDIPGYRVKKKKDNHAV